MNRAVAFTLLVLAHAATLAGCAQIEPAELPGSGIVYTPVIVGATERPQGWRYLEQRPAPDAPPIPFVAYSARNLTLSVSCQASDEARHLRVGAAQRNVFHAQPTIAVRYRFDEGPERSARWSWLNDAAAQGGPAAVEFARNLAKSHVLRFRLEDGTRQTVSLKGSAAPIKRVLRACGDWTGS